MAGVTAYHSCFQHSLRSASFLNGEEELKAWRNCNRTGWWAEEDYSKCPYSQEVTQILHAFSQVNHTVMHRVYCMCKCYTVLTKFLQRKSLLSKLYNRF